MVPTAVTRYKTTAVRDSGGRFMFNKSMDLRNDEALSLYQFGHLVIRWSTFRVFTDRFLGR